MTISVERPLPAYVLPDLAEHPAITRRIYRYDGGPLRYYCATDTDPAQWALSVTSVIKATRPTSEYLMQWRANLGNDEYRRVLDESAAYGTWMHSRWCDALIKGEVNLNPDALIHTMRDCPDGAEDEWLRRGQNDLLSLAAWAADRHPEVLAIETVMLHKDDLWYGGAIDLVCRLDFDKKRVVAIVDFKSGKSFYENHELQLHIYKNVWNSWFGGTEYEATHTFNLAPKDWKTKPSFKFENQSEKPSAALVPHIISMCAADENIPKHPEPFKRYSGTYQMGEPVDVECETVDPITYIMEKHNG